MLYMFTHTHTHTHTHAYYIFMYTTYAYIMHTIHPCILYIHVYNTQVTSIYPKTYLYRFIHACMQRSTHVLVCLCVYKLDT